MCRIWKAEIDKVVPQAKLGGCPPLYYSDGGDPGKAGGAAFLGTVKRCDALKFPVLPHVSAGMPPPRRRLPGAPVVGGDVETIMLSSGVEERLISPFSDEKDMRLEMEPLGDGGWDGRGGGPD